MLATPWVIPAVLLPMLAASTFVYWVLVRRWTVGRRWANLSEWAATNEFRLSREHEPPLPDPLAFLPQPRTLLCLSAEKTIIAQVQTATSPGQDGSQPAQWNLLLRKLESDWPLTGLRPSKRSMAALDFLPPAGLHAFIPGDRFILYGQQRLAARELGNSAVRGLLPPDLGLLLLPEGWLVLDFSTRPFDPLEFQRMCDLAQQLVAHLPIRKKPGT
jgi:hypothetical protein